MSKDNENPIASQLEGDDAISRFLVQSGDVLGVLPLRNKVLFPSVLMPITVTRPKSQNSSKKRSKTAQLSLSSPSANRA